MLLTLSPRKYRRRQLVSAKERESGTLGGADNAERESARLGDVHNDERNGKISENI